MVVAARQLAGVVVVAAVGGIEWQGGAQAGGRGIIHETTVQSTVVR